MKIDDIKGAICTYFNGMELFCDCPFVKSPSNKPAPVGNYIAVSISDVQQVGGEMKPGGPGEGKSRFSQHATVVLTEVEGDGDNLRQVRNLVQRKEFREHARAAEFTVWEQGSIMAIDTFDGEFLVRQWRFTMGVNFVDEYELNVPRICSANIEIHSDDDVYDVSVDTEN